MKMTDFWYWVGRTNSIYVRLEFGKTYRDLPLEISKAGIIALTSDVSSDKVINAFVEHETLILGPFVLGK